MNGRYIRERSSEPLKHRGVVIDAHRAAFSTRQAPVPTPISGECTDLPGDLIYHGASVYTATEGNGDYIEHGIFAIDAWSNVYLVDWWRDRRSTDVWIEREHDLIIAMDLPRFSGEGLAQLAAIFSN